VAITRLTRSSAAWLAFDQFEQAGGEAAPGFATGPQDAHRPAAASAQHRDQPGLRHGRLAAARSADDGDEGLAVDGGDEFAGERVAAEEDRLVLFAESAQVAVGAVGVGRALAERVERAKKCAEIGLFLVAGIALHDLQQQRQGMPRADEAAFEQITDAAQGELSRRTALVYRIVNVAMLVVKARLSQVSRRPASIRGRNSSLACWRMSMADDGREGRAGVILVMFGVLRSFDLSRKPFQAGGRRWRPRLAAHCLPSLPWPP
jgi:hypothetical protein